MNYQNYVEQLSKNLLKFQASGQYYPVNIDIGSSQTIEEILRDLEECINPSYKKIADLQVFEGEGTQDFQIWEPFQEFYQAAAWIDFDWRYIGHSDLTDPPCGASDIYTILSLYAPFEFYIPEENRMIDVLDNEMLNQPFKLSDEYRTFDRIGLDNDTHVAVKFLSNQEEPRLYYYTLKTKSYYKMSISFDEYLELLLQTRGVYSWQKFFIDDSNFRLDLARAEQVIKDLELLFPEVDRTIFESQLAKRRAINLGSSSQNPLS